jgi:murein DD-endopeptidase MepM/ murein hydrolase activator NlpD
MPILAGMSVLGVGRRRVLVIAAVALAVAAPVAGATVLLGGGSHDQATGARTGKGGGQDSIDRLIAQHRAHPEAVEPQVGVPEATAAVPTDVPAPARAAVKAGGRGGVSPGAPSDAQIKQELEALQREQAKVQRAILASGGPIRAGSGRFIWPVNGPITSPFCERRAWEACHPGIDIGVPTGTPIHAADTGQVVLAGPQGGYGNFTCIEHTRTLTTCYAHQSRIMVQIGQVVQKGQVIGLVGCTGLCFGSHLHFEVRVNGHVVNPVDYL